MNGPAHYAEAERLAASAKDRDLPADAVRAVADLAQVHATLALTAATALGGITLTLPQGSDLAAGWNGAIGITDEESKS